MYKEKSRHCYCGHVTREMSEKQGVEEGYCGICDICSGQGHLRHAPGGAPSTGAWCDRCFKVQAIISNAQMLGVPLIIIALISTSVVLGVIGLFLLVQGILLNSFGKAVIRRIAGT